MSQSQHHHLQPLFISTDPYSPAAENIHLDTHTTTQLSVSHVPGAHTPSTEIYIFSLDSNRPLCLFTVSLSHHNGQLSIDWDRETGRYWKRAREMGKAIKTQDGMAKESSRAANRNFNFPRSNITSIVFGHLKGSGCRSDQYRQDWTISVFFSTFIWTAIAAISLSEFSIRSLT